MVGVAPRFRYTYSKFPAYYGSPYRSPYRSPYLQLAYVKIVL